MISFVLNLIFFLFLSTGLTDHYSSSADYSFELSRHFTSSPAKNNGTAYMRLLVDNPIELRTFDIPEVSDKFNEMMLSGIMLTYENAPYLDKSFATFDSLIVMRPDRPEGYFLKASLLLSIYQVDKNQAVFDSLKVYADKTIGISKKLLDEQPDNKFLHFYLGGIYGNMGLQYLRQGSYWSAYRNGSKGKGHLEKALKIDPEFADAELGIGIFKYYADVLPRYMKPLLFLVRLSGNREEGLSKIKLAAEKSALSRIEANFFYAKILQEYEGDPAGALDVGYQLHNQFPDNMFYHYSLGQFLYENGMLPESRELFEQLKKRPHRYYNRSVGYYYGIILHSMGEYENSTTQLMGIISLYPNNYKDRLRDIYFRIGLNYEYLEERENALLYYVQAKNIGSDIHKEKLKQLLKAPLTPEDIKIKNVDSLIKSNLLNNALSVLRKNLTEFAENSNVDKKFEALSNLQLAEIQLLQGNYDDSKRFLDENSEKLYKYNREYLARYHTVGALVYLESNDRDKVQKYLKKLNKIDFKKIPIFYKRTYNMLQREYYGVVKNR